MKNGEPIFSDSVAVHNPKQGYSYSFASEDLSLTDIEGIVEAVDTETIFIHH